MPGGDCFAWKRQPSSLVKVKRSSLFLKIYIQSWSSGPTTLMTRECKKKEKPKRKTWRGKESVYLWLLHLIIPLVLTHHRSPPGGRVRSFILVQENSGCHLFSDVFIHPPNIFEWLYASGIIADTMDMVIMKKWQNPCHHRTYIF